MHKRETRTAAHLQSQIDEDMLQSRPSHRSWRCFRPAWRAAHSCSYRCDNYYKHWTPLWSLFRGNIMWWFSSYLAYIFLIIFVYLEIIWHQWC